MSRLLDWLHDHLPDSRVMCLGYLGGAVLCVAKGVLTISTEQFMLGRRSRTPLLEGKPAIIAGIVLLIMAVLLLLLCLRYVKEMRSQYQGYE